MIKLTTLVVVAISTLAGCSSSSKTVIEPAESSARRVHMEIERGPDPAPPPVAAPAVEEPVRIRIHIMPEHEPEPEVQGNLGDSAHGLRFADILGVMALGAVMSPALDPQEAMTMEQVQQMVGDLPPNTKAIVTIEDATGRGVGVSTASDEVVSSLDTSAPLASTTGSSGSGGSTAWMVEAAAAAGPGLLAVGPIGLVVAAIGVGLSVYGRTKIGVPLIAAGVALAGLGLLSAKYPWVLAIGGLLVVGIAGFAIWAGLRGTTAVDAAKAVTRGVADTAKTDPASAEAVKEHVAARPESDERVRALIRKVRAG